MTRAALVVGAGGAVGEAAATELARRGWRVSASMHRPRPHVAQRLRSVGADIAFHDLTADAAQVHGDYDAIVLTPHLALSLRMLERSDVGKARVVVFSSNNVAAHAESAASRELAVAEERLRARCPLAAIVRPTMIYGDPRLQTMTRLVLLARRLPILPMPGSGRARLQPVFHADLGRVAAGLAEAEAPGAFAVGGPEIVSLRELYEAVMTACGRRRPIAPIPAPLLAFAAALPAFALSSDQAARADRDRIAVPADPLPPALAPQTSLERGLAHLVAAIDDLAQRPDHGLAA